MYHTKRLLIAVALLILLSVAYICSYRFFAGRYEPPEGHPHIYTVCERLPSAYDVWLVNHTEDRYLLVDAGSLPLVFLPSGSVLYLFDSHGHLVEWTIDSGEHVPPMLSSVIGKRSSGRKLTAEQLSQVLGTVGN
ncbi:hypothetical protein ANRL1_02825 [Anaerolineae bacterium]|nr:hypothetical protein ANRL1_02825 [Anaerolineae bacterium]